MNPQTPQQKRTWWFALAATAALVFMLSFLSSGCATAPGEREDRPFYYFHTNYPEQFEPDAGCHGCDSRYSDEPKRSHRGFSERERNRRLQKLYGRMGR